MKPSDLASLESYDGLDPHNASFCNWLFTKAYTKAW